MVSLWGVHVESVGESIGESVESPLGVHGESVGSLREVRGGVCGESVGGPWGSVGGPKSKVLV